ncbi:MAG: histidine phosphatase family protein [Novosphingobium sp.]
MILLIRHAAHSHLGTILSGRTPGIGLSPKGRAQADALARRLEATTIDAVHASPVQRAQETAAAIAARHGLPVETVAALDEVDFGDWAGRGFAELAGDPRWDAWNAARASAPTPGGETMAQAQARAWNHIAQAAAVEPGRTIAMISHCDIIRAVLAEALGLSLDHLHRFDIGPASISRLVIGPWGEKVLSMNENCQ